MINKAQFDTDKAHHWFGVEFNNRIFPLLEKAGRSEEETELMIALAYASTLHWISYSKHTIANRARGENMIAAALTYAGRKESALHHAERNYNLVFNNKNEMADFDVSYALMAMARAYALNNDIGTAKKYYNECLVSIEEIRDLEDKKILVSDLNSGPWYGLK
jgi:hypothetical protein